MEKDCLDDLAWKRWMRVPPDVQGYYIEHGQELLAQGFERVWVWRLVEMQAQAWMRIMHHPSTASWNPDPCFVFACTKLFDALHHEIDMTDCEGAQA